MPLGVGTIPRPKILFKKSSVSTGSLVLLKMMAASPIQCPAASIIGNFTRQSSLLNGVRRKGKWKKKGKEGSVLLLRSKVCHQ